MFGANYSVCDPSGTGSTQNKLPLIVMLWPSSSWLLFSLAAARGAAVSARIAQPVWEGEHIIIPAARYTANANKGGPLGCLKKKGGDGDVISVLYLSWDLRGV